jgi:ligand-binding sensor domain-containing protein
VGPTIASGTPVRALLATGDTLWVGSDAGLLLLPPGNDTMPRRPATARQEPRLAQPVRAIAHSDSIVVVATADELVRFNLSTGGLLPRLDAVNVRAVGSVNTLAMDGSTLWVGGPLGVLLVDRGTGTARLLGSAYQVTSETFDIALTRDYAWLATRDGVVRLRRLPNGTVR